MRGVFRVGIIAGLMMSLIVFVAEAVAADRGMEILQQKCISCHDLHGPAPATLAELWQRKGPDMFYAGNKYQTAWLESWLQHPRRIRPAGMFYVDHIKPGAKRDVIDTSTLSEHMQLNAADAKAVAKTLAGMKANEKLIKSETHRADVSPGPLGEMMFDKIYGCMACHEIEPGYGGLSGPELYTAGKRLKPEFMLSYIRSPQAWDPKIWMPNKHVPDDNIQKLVNYIIALSEENFDE